MSSRAAASSLSGRIQEAYGLTKDEAERQLRNWERNLAVEYEEARTRDRRRRAHAYQRTEVAMITMNGIRNASGAQSRSASSPARPRRCRWRNSRSPRASLERAEQAQAAQFAQVELNSARNKFAAAQAAADKHDAEVAARLADQADVDAQLAESTARAKQQEQLVNEMEAGLRDLRDETLRHDSAGSTPQAPQPPPPPRRSLKGGTS